LLVCKELLGSSRHQNLRGLCVFGGHAIAIHHHLHGVGGRSLLKLLSSICSLHFHLALPIYLHSLFQDSCLAADNWWLPFQRRDHDPEEDDL